MNKKVLICCGIMAILFVGCEKGRQAKPGQIDESLMGGQKAALLKQIDHNYTDPEPHYQLGKLYQADGLYNRAEWEFNVTLQFDPVSYKAQAAKVKLLMDMKQDDRAKMAAEIYMNQAAASAQASSLLGRAFQKEGLDDYALSAYQQAMSQAPNSAALQRQIGYYYLSQNDTVRAEEYLRRSIQLDPYQPEVAEQLGRMGVVVQLPRNAKEQSKDVDKTLNQEDQQGDQK